MIEAVDLLYIILAIAIALVAIFLSIVLVYSIFILRDINKATDAIRDSAEKVHATILKPIKMTGELLKYARPVVEVVGEKIKEKSEECERNAAKKNRNSKKRD